MKRPKSSAASARAWIDADTCHHLPFIQLARMTTAMEAHEPPNPVDGPSALGRFVPVRQPGWGSEAERVAAVQARMQAVGPAFLHAVALDGKPFILRELQPTEDRLILERWGGYLGRLERVLRTMGRLTAWSQLRSGGRQGSAIADELIAFGGRAGWSGELLRHAREYARQVKSDWLAFVKAVEVGL